MSWHKDFGKKTMIVQLNDNTNAIGTGVKYSGGGLNIGEKSAYCSLGIEVVERTVENLLMAEVAGMTGFYFPMKKGSFTGVRISYITAKIMTSWKKNASWW